MSDGIALLQATSVCKRFGTSGVQALTDVNLEAHAGETVALVGPSGCGKSTLLSVLGLLETPSSGRVSFGGREAPDIRAAHRFRASTLGFVFQFHHLIPTMTLAENVASPLVAAGISSDQRKKRALEVLDQVGLLHRAAFLPASVSGGERQRAAIARAIVNRPAIVLADEPTGNLDSANGLIVQQLLVAQARQQGALVVVATHNADLAAALDRRVNMLDGRLCSA